MLGAEDRHLYPAVTIVKFATRCLFFLFLWSGQVLAHPDEEVRKLVRGYFAAFQAHEWKTVVAMYHPDTLTAFREQTLLAKAFPRTSAELHDVDRADFADLFELLKVKTPEEAWALPSAVFYERMLDFAGKNGMVDRVKEAEITIKEIKVKEEKDGFHADVEIESTLRGKLYPVITHFIIESVEGNLKVISMTKTKREPRDLEGSVKPVAPNEDPDPGRKPE
jgi:hypothetical protein